MSVDLHAVYEAGRVRRWHTNPALSWTDDYLDGHQGRCARLALALFPSDTALHTYMLIHDDGEWVTGDVARDAKRQMPAGARTWLEDAEATGRFVVWGSIAAIEPTNMDRAKLCDSLDAYLWMLVHAAHLRDREDWRRHRAEIEALAIACGVADAVMPVIGGRG